MQYLKKNASATVYKETLFTLLSLFNLSFAISQREYIVTVDPANGNIFKIDSIPGVRWLQSYSTYNQTTHEYTIMGSLERAQPPVYLYTLNAETGNVIFKPVVSSPNSLISMQYSRSTGILYGIIFQNNNYYLATIDKTSAAFSLIKDIPGITAVSSFTIDEANQRLFIRAVDNNPSFALWTIDLATGNIIYHVSTPGLGDLHYDNVTHKIYAWTSRFGPTPGSNILSLCTVEPSTGVVTNIADLPGVTGILAGDHGTINENQHQYFLVGIEQTPPAFLYSVDITSGSIIQKTAISTSGVLDNDNLIFFRYDNTSNKLYALLWEAKTALPVVVDSTCRLNVLTKIYPNPFNNTLNIDKNPTVCKPTIRIYNTIGQLILKDRTINDGHNEINLSFLSSGIYYYEFISDGKIVFSGKVIRL